MRIRRNASETENLFLGIKSLFETLQRPALRERLRRLPSVERLFFLAGRLQYSENGRLFSGLLSAAETKDYFPVYSPNSSYERPYDGSALTLNLDEEG